MAGPITIPAGALAAAKSGAPQPTAAAAPAPKEAAPTESPKQAPPKEAPAPREAAGGEPPAAMTAAEKKIWKIKAAGKEIDYDASDEERIKRDIQKALGADETFQTAAQMKKQAEEFFGMLKDPAKLKKLLTDPRIGVDLKKFAEEQVWESIQQEKREAEWAKDPAAKDRWEREQRLLALEEKEKTDKAAAEANTKAEEVRVYEAHYEKTILSALEVGGIPKTTEAAARMGHYLGLAMEQGIDLSPAELVEVVRDDYIREFGEVFGQADGDQLLAFLGEGNAKKVREADLKRLKTAQSKPFPKRSEAKQAAAGRGQEPAAGKKQGATEWRDGLIKDFLGRK